jgi:YHS domain-containing protein
MKALFTFLATFVLGALIALGARTALHDPHAGHDTAGSVTSRGDYAPLVNNSPPLPPSSPAKPSTPAPPASDSHAGPTAAKNPVNTVCAICGMKVDPALPTVEYQGKTIGFGCKMCAPKFKADPDKYGPTYLRNELIKR